MTELREHGAPQMVAASGPKASTSAAGASLASATPASGSQHIDEIDTLRALAMSAVVAQHCKILPFGWMGVWLFFVISGFVVTTSLMTRSSDDAGSLLKHFYIRRAARILPIYLGYTLAGFLLSGLAVGYLEWRPFASLALFYNNFESAFGIGGFKAFPVGHLWTISVEMQFYLLFGFAFAFMSRRVILALLAVLLIIAPLLRWVGGQWLDQAGFPPLQAAFAVYTFSPMHFDSFAAGALLAMVRAQGERPGRAGTLFATGVLAMIAYATAYALANRVHGAHGVGMFRNIVSGILFGDLRQVWLYSGLALLSSGAIAMTLTGAAPWSPIARNRMLQAVGRVSYGGYVYHPLCVLWVGRGLGLLMSPPANMIGKLEFGVLRFALALPATVALAMLSYRFVERPIITWVNGRLSTLRSSACSAPALSQQPDPVR